jgi:hypothetical protein
MLKSKLMLFFSSLFIFNFRFKNSTLKIEKKLILLSPAMPQTQKTTTTTTTTTSTNHKTWRV